jgi:lipopolysaccharide assembly protein A
MRFVFWLARAFIFFTLFAFALNNQHTVIVHWFFGAQWHTPMVIVVLVAFGAGCAVGLVAMLPGLWQRRRLIGTPPASAPAPAAPASAAPSSLLPSEFGPAEHPPRVGP